MAEIVLESITKTFTTGTGERVVALAEFDARFADGSVTALMGRTGAGKSTVLRIIAGLASPDDGRVLFDGVDVTSLPTEARDVALVPSDGTLHPRRSVAEHFADGLRHRGLAESEIADRVVAEARALGLGRVLDHRPGSLSDGDRRLVALGRALVRRPQALLLDAPLLGLDPREQLRVRRQIAHLQAGLRVTSIRVAATFEEAVAADLLVVLDAGRPAQEDPPGRCYARPRSTLVAEQVAPDMGLLPGSVSDDGVVLGGQQLRLPPAARSARRPPGAGTGRVLLGIRPWGLGLEPPGERLVVGVVAVRGAGPARQVEVAPEPTVRPDAATFTVPWPADRPVAPGDGVVLHVDAAACSLFDAASGLAVWHGAQQGDPE